MSEESPPSFTTSVFNQANFTQVSSVDTEYLNENYVKYPITQTGTITIANLAITNDATVNGLTVGRGNNSVSTSSAVGVSALGSSTGVNCTALGYQSGFAGTANITGTNNTFIGYQAKADGSAYSTSTALGSGATIKASNTIVLGTTTETIKYNKAAPLYTSIPTYTNADIGYVEVVGNTITAITNTEQTILTSSSLPIGVYMICCSAQFISASGATNVTVTFLVAAVETKILINSVASGDEIAVAFSDIVKLSAASVLTVRVKTSAATTITGLAGNTDDTNLTIVRIA